MFSSSSPLSLASSPAHSMLVPSQLGRQSPGVLHDGHSLPARSVTSATGSTHPICLQWASSACAAVSILRVRRNLCDSSTRGPTHISRLLRQGATVAGPNVSIASGGDLLACPCRPLHLRRRNKLSPWKVFFGRFQGIAQKRSVFFGQRAAQSGNLPDTARPIVASATVARPSALGHCRRPWCAPNGCG